MKVLIILLMLATQPTFCDGWEVGYVNGYCYEELYCIPPIVPICPFPEFGQDNYKAGEYRGFLQGMEDAGRE